MSSTRPSTPGKTLWFEFLLAPSLLEKHLSQPHPDPSATELILQFLSNVSLFSTEQTINAQTTPSQINSGPPAVIPAPLPNQDAENTQKVPSENESENKKSLALKLLALKVAAFLKWNLNLLEKELPLPIQEHLIKDIQNVIELPEEKEHSDKEKSLPDELFANIMYNRWNLRAALKSCYPVRGQKGLTVQIPGQVDPTFVPQDVMESITRKLCEQSGQACKSLEEALNNLQPVRMPLINCIGAISEDSSEPKHNWENGIFLNADELKCQISYDLGCYYFYQEEYKKAGEMFTQSSSLYSKLKDSVYCKIDEVKLKGYCGACTHLLKQQSSSSMTSLMERFQTSAANGYKEVVAILTEDNLKREIPLSLREALEMDLLQKKEQLNDTFFKVIALNAVRRVIDGQLVTMNFHIALKSKEEKVMDNILEAMKAVHSTLSNQQKILLKNFIRMLYNISNSVANKLKSDDVINIIFDEKEVCSLYESNLETVGKKDSYLEKQNFTGDIKVKVGQLERELLSASSPETICSLVKQLQSLSSAKPLWTLNRKWELPRPIASLVRNVQSSEMIHILLAKAAELRAIKNYVQARALYKLVQEELKGGAPRLLWMIGWELLHTDLLEITEAPAYKLQDPKQYHEITQKAKACLKAYLQEREAPPDPFLLNLCAVVLLNLRDWDSLVDLKRNEDGYLELSSLLASVCCDICANKGSRAAARDLWDGIIPIFMSSNNQHKRSSSGVIKEMQRELPHGVMPRASFIQFVTTLSDTLVLTVVISCISKLYNILKDNSNGEIFFEYSVLWPAVVTNANMFNVQMVTDTLHEILQYALSVHPTHSSWLKTRGDFMYVQGHYAAAMKHYLSAAMISSDYFSQPLPRALFDDTQFKHMIHCCTKLQCHTQAAILGQCLEELNYASMFKSLGEKVCNDSCDTFYPCIWDVTLLEFLINLHARRGEIDRRQLAVHLIGQLELNSNNNEEIQHEAANIRKGRFFRAIAKQYL